MIQILEWFRVGAVLILYTISKVIRWVLFSEWSRIILFWSAVGFIIWIFYKRLKDLNQYSKENLQNEMEKIK